MRIKTSAHLTSEVPHAPEATQKSKSIFSRFGRKLPKLPYIILDNHISKMEALHLLGRIVYKVRRPLECYVPPAALMCAPSHTLPVCSTPGPSHSGPSTSGSTPNSAVTITAQAAYPEYDPELFVLPNLPLSVSESTSTTLFERTNYSSQTQSALRSLLGLSFSLKRMTSRSITLNTKVLRVLSLNQHSEVFSRLVGLYGKRIKVALKRAGGTMYFVTGIKLSTDATVETRQEEGRSVAGNVAVNATQITGLGTLGTAGIEQGQVLSGRHIQKELERATTADIKGERAIAVEYYCVQLQRKLELIPTKPAHKRSGSVLMYCLLPCLFPCLLICLRKRAAKCSTFEELGGQSAKIRVWGEADEDGDPASLVESCSSSQVLSVTFGEYPEIRVWAAEGEADEDGNSRVCPTAGGPSRFQQETLASNNEYNLVELLPSELNHSLELLFGENPELQLWDAEYESDEDDEFEVVLGNKVLETFR